MRGNTLLLLLLALVAGGGALRREELAAKLQAQIRGRVMSSHLDTERRSSNVVGAHTVIKPESEEDVVNAMMLSRVTGRKAMVISGQHSSRNEAVDGTDGILINMRRLKDISFDGNRVTIQAGVLNGQVIN